MFTNGFFVFNIFNYFDKKSYFCILKHLNKT